MTVIVVLLGDYILTCSSVVVIRTFAKNEMSFSDFFSRIRIIFLQIRYRSLAILLKHIANSFFYFLCNLFATVLRTRPKRDMRLADLFSQIKHYIPTNNLVRSRPDILKAVFWRGDLLWVMLATDCPVWFAQFIPHLVYVIQISFPTFRLLIQCLSIGYLLWIIQIFPIHS